MHKNLTALMSPMPEWLGKIAKFERGPLPIKNILRDSLYYPFCGIDGTPVKFLCGLVYSFVYVDYGMDSIEVLREMVLLPPFAGFNGYSSLHIREVTSDELVPTDWKPLQLLPRDGVPERGRQFMRKPFGFWAVYQRDEDLDDAHGPERFSFLYIVGEGVTNFQSLYHGNKCTPKIVAIIQPGVGFGGNWTDPRNPDKIFGRSVLQNPYEIPEFLLCGNWGAPDSHYNCWPDFYDKRIFYAATKEGSVVLWQRKDAKGQKTHEKQADSNCL